MTDPPVTGPAMKTPTARANPTAIGAMAADLPGRIARTSQETTLYLTRRILQESPSIRVLVVTLFEDEDSVFMALRAGARGYVLKDANEEEMVLSIRAVGRGEAIFSPAIAERVLAYFTAYPPGGAPPQVFPTLTDREREIRNLIAQGHPNPSIARQLSLSTKTVGNYVSNIFTKLQVRDRVQAVIRAREAGLG